jgi:hypothetical protein
MSRTEMILVERMAQHHWLRNRAEFLQSNCFHDDGSVDEKRLALYLRFQTTHERAFHKCLNDLLKLRAEKRKHEIGFESQTRVKEEHTHKQEQHQMKKDHHQMVRHISRSQGLPPANPNRSPGNNPNSRPAKS